MIKKPIFFCLLLIIFLNCALAAEPKVEPKKIESLNLKQCIDLAFKNHPDIKAAMFNIKIYEAQVGQVRSALLPQLNYNLNYQRSKNTSPLSPTDLRNYTTGVSLSQNITDFGETAYKIYAARYYYQAAYYDMLTTTQGVILKVKTNYYTYLKTKKLVEVNEESVKQFEEHLRQAEGFYKVGTKPKSDVTKAEVDLASANLNLITARSNFRLTIDKLNNAMGISDPFAYDLVDDLTVQEFTLSQDDCLKIAFVNRPDYLSALLQEKALANTLKSRISAYNPSLSASAGYNFASTSFPPRYANWNFGLSFTFSLFDGGLTVNQVKEARARLSYYKETLESTRQSIILDVRGSYLSLRDAEERIKNSQKALQLAEENFRLAKGRYQAEIGSPIEFTDAQVALTKAKTDLIGALSDYKIAMSNLEKAMGVIK